jgi:hypothetical protein
MGDLGAGPRLVVPEGLVIDESARERLARRLSLAPGSIAGVGAEISDLVPGSSYRVDAEWATLDSPQPGAQWPRTAATTTNVRGAALLRPETAFEVRDGRVEIAAGELFLEPGAKAHDPYGPIGPLEPASERGRPPFPRRPVVVLLGCEDTSATDFARRLANRLLRRGVEARLAFPEVADGLHLTRPCLPSEATIRALAPDVVVTFDAAAASRVDAWCAGNRSAVVVEFDRELSDPMELVSWQISRAQGRLRARIGLHVDVPAFASLIGRLCAGPQPEPPRERSSYTPAEVRERWAGRAEVGARPRCAVVTGPLSAPATARLEGLADHLEATGWDHLAAAGWLVPLARLTPRVAREAANAALVVLAGVEPTPAVNELIESRRAAGRPTVVDVTRDDLETGPDAAARLKASSSAVARACGLVVSPAGAASSAVERTGLRSLLLPTLLTRTRAAELEDARAPLDPSNALVIGWCLPDGGFPQPEVGDAVAEAMAECILDRDRRIEIVGDAENVPAALRGHRRVRVLAPGALPPALVASWAVNVWTPTFLAGEVADDSRELDETSHAGVASVMPAAAGGAVDGYVSPQVLVPRVEATEDWAAALGHVLDERRRWERRTAEAIRRSDALAGAAAARAAINRFIGWVTYAAPQSATGEPVIA